MQREFYRSKQLFSFSSQKVGATGRLWGLQKQTSVFIGQYGEFWFGLSSGGFFCWSSFFPTRFPVSGTLCQPKMADGSNNQVGGVLEFLCKQNAEWKLKSGGTGFVNSYSWLLKTNANRLSFECLKRAFFFLVMPNVIFFWKDYTKSFPAEKTGLWKMVSENVINHAKVVQGVFEMNIWLWAAELSLTPSSFSSQLFERVLRGETGQWTKLYLFPFQPILNLRKESDLSVFTKGAKIQEKSQFLLTLLATPKEK